MLRHNPVYPFLNSKIAWYCGIAVNLLKCIKPGRFCSLGHLDKAWSWSFNYLGCWQVSTFGIVQWLFSPSLVAAVIPLLGIWWQASRKAGKEDELLGLSDGQRLMSAFRNKIPWYHIQVTYGIPIASMHGIFAYIHHQNQPNVGKYAIHGLYGIL